MGTVSVVVIVGVAIALAFDVINGFHDAANSIATVVSTRVLKPQVAVLWAAFFNFVAMFVFAPKVADTISKIVHIKADDPAYVYVILAGLVGAIVWDLLTWWWALPTSSSHALIGGYAGAAIMRSGFGVIIPAGWSKTLLFIFVAPLMGLVLGFSFMVAVFWLLRNKSPQRVDAWFRRLQLLSAAAYSIGHGGNDAQKTMGIIATALFGAGYVTRSELAGNWGRFHWPIILAAHAAIALGTYFGGWRIVHTMGSRITKLKPVGGFCAETAGAITRFSASLAGIPVSTTHTITGAIVGVGATTRLSAVRWGIARRIVAAWIFTIPASAVVGAATFWAIRFFKPGA